MKMWANTRFDRVPTELVVLGAADTGTMMKCMIAKTAKPKGGPQTRGFRASGSPSGVVDPHRHSVATIRGPR